MAVPLFFGFCLVVVLAAGYLGLHPGNRTGSTPFQLATFLDTYLSTMNPFTLKQIENAIRGSFALDTCSPDDVNEWSETNRSRGHCAVTTLVLHDFLGGELVCAEVHAYGERFGWHWWNRLGDFDLDLTRDQFFPHEIVGEPWVTERPVGNDHFYAGQYLLFRSRVLASLTLSFRA